MCVCGVAFRVLTQKYIFKKGGVRIKAGGVKRLVNGQTKAMYFFAYISRILAIYFEILHAFPSPECYTLKGLRNCKVCLSRCLKEDIKTKQKKIHIESVARFGRDFSVCVRLGMSRSLSNRWGQRDVKGLKM